MTKEHIISELLQWILQVIQIAFLFIIKPLPLNQCHTTICFHDKTTHTSRRHWISQFQQPHNVRICCGYFH